MVHLGHHPRALTPAMRSTPRYGSSATLNTVPKVTVAIYLTYCNCIFGSFGDEMFLFSLSLDDFILDFLSDSDIWICIRSWIQVQATILSASQSI